MKEEFKIHYTNDLWKIRRLMIMAADNFTCQHCKGKESLQVHHHTYCKLLKAWEYEDRHLTTLCQRCHERFHKDHQPNYQPKLKKFTIPDIFIEKYKELNYDGFVAFLVDHYRENVLYRSAMNIISMVQSHCIQHKIQGCYTIKQSLNEVLRFVDLEATKLKSKPIKRKKK